MNILHEFFNHKSDANKYLTAEQQEDLEKEFVEWLDESPSESDAVEQEDVEKELSIERFQKMYEAYDNHYIVSNDVQDLKESYYYKGRRDEAIAAQQSKEHPVTDAVEQEGINNMADVTFAASEAIMFGEWMLKNKLKPDYYSQNLMWGNSDVRLNFGSEGYTTEKLYEIFRANQLKYTITKK